MTLIALIILILALIGTPIFVIMGIVSLLLSLIQGLRFPPLVWKFIR